MESCYIKNEVLKRQKYYNLIGMLRLNEKKFISVPFFISCSCNCLQYRVTSHMFTSKFIILTQKIQGLKFSRLVPLFQSFLPFDAIYSSSVPLCESLSFACPSPSNFIPSTSSSESSSPDTSAFSISARSILRAKSASSIAVTTLG